MKDGELECKHLMGSKLWKTGNWSANIKWVQSYKRRETGVQISNGFKVMKDGKLECKYRMGSKLWKTGNWSPNIERVQSYERRGTGVQTSNGFKVMKDWGLEYKHLMGSKLWKTGNWSANIKWVQSYERMETTINTDQLEVERFLCVLYMHWFWPRNFPPLLPARSGCTTDDLSTVETLRSNLLSRV